MGDAGEGLVDAEARIAERREEREQERRRVAAPRVVNAERLREIESLKLATTEMQRQFALTTHAGRRGQIEQAVKELARRIDALTKS